MIGCYDFCGHYEWTFEWLRQWGGEQLVLEYWDEAIRKDSQQHAVALIIREGFAGMEKYWAHTLEHEGAGYHTTSTNEVFRIDMHDCPSKGFLINNGLLQYSDYCDHCMGWVGPLMQEAGFVVDHEHNHRGQCWWEMRRLTDQTPASGPRALSGDHDVRLLENWRTAEGKDIFRRATSPRDKQPTENDV